jgi:hypothetical protein
MIGQKDYIKNIYVKVAEIYGSHTMNIHLVYSFRTNIIIFDIY